MKIGLAEVGTRAFRAKESVEKGKIVRQEERIHCEKSVLVRALLFEQALSGQEEKRTTEDEMAGWHHRLDGHEFEKTSGVCDGQGRHGVL